jgi:hypothetical protein
MAQEAKKRDTPCDCGSEYTGIHYPGCLWAGSWPSWNNSDKLEAEERLWRQIEDAERDSR